MIEPASARPSPPVCTTEPGASRSQPVSLTERLAVVGQGTQGRALERRRCLYDRRGYIGPANVS
jgi:hypothetical protein